MGDKYCKIVRRKSSHPGGIKSRRYKSSLPKEEGTKRRIHRQTKPILSSFVIFVCFTVASWLIVGWVYYIATKDATILNALVKVLEAIIAKMPSSIGN